MWVYLDMSFFFTIDLFIDFKVNNYDASLSDCSKVLANDPSHIKGLFAGHESFVQYVFSVWLALFRRASCFLAKQQYDDAKRDLDHLLNVDSENTEAKVG